MTIVAGEVPRESAMGPAWTDGAWFRDSYRTSLAHPEASVFDVFEAVFGHHPGWMKQALLMRNRLVRRIGLAVPEESDITRFERKVAYRVGDKIGPWPIHVLTERELVAGRDNRHLDFRVSILKIPTGDGVDVAISTVCRVHNLFGKVYLAGVIPFHKFGVKYLMRQAVEARRL